MDKNPCDCALHKVHHPSVAILHRIVIDDQLFFVCGTGLDNLRLCVRYMNNGVSPSTKIGRDTWDMAQKIIAANKVAGL